MTYAEPPLLPAERRRRAWMRPVAFVTRIAVYGALLFTLYAFSPDSIGETPFAALTLNKVLGALLFVGAALFLVRCLFNPSDDPDTQERWGSLGLILIALATVAVFLLALAKG